VQGAAAECLRGGRVLPSRAAVAALVRGPGYRRLVPHFAHVLSRHPGSLLPLGEAVLAVCDRVSEPGRTGPPDEFLLFVHTLFRMYEQSEAAADDDTRTACLDRWDGLLETRNIWVGNALDRLDSGRAVE